MIRNIDSLFIVQRPISTSSKMSIINKPRVSIKIKETETFNYVILPILVYVYTAGRLVRKTDKEKIKSGLTRALFLWT